MEYLFEEGCDIFHRGDDEDRLNSGLHISVRYGNVDGCVWLLEHGLDPESINENGNNCVDISNFNGFEDISEMLVDNINKYNREYRVRKYLDVMIDELLDKEEYDRCVPILREIYQDMKVMKEMKEMVKVMKEMKVKEDMDMRDIFEKMEVHYYISHQLLEMNIF
eukprot:CAMPEP_0174825876 /NCGR_PEP_ID=MMETSP1107-20130205/43209_1 /TAXON_ID=36770 /ORGANISM="Paraphysomonas vestita, Strain GFlagA" /LENGTH=164 /DNA_ID=CAMNT_0016057949 /DNA_START=1905 /DNA_END=2400 /DNA_ORIENTATION=+